MLNHNQTPIVHSSQLDYSLAGLGRFPFCLELLSGFVFLQCVLPLPSWTPHYGGVRLRVCFCNKFGCSDHRSVYLHCTAITIRCYGDYSFFLAAIISAWLLSLSLAPIQYLVKRTESKDLQRTFEITRIAVMEVVPTVVLITTTIRMLLIRKKHRQQAAIQVAQLRYNKWRGEPDCHFKLSRTRREMSTVQIICAVVTVFVVCYATNILLSFCIDLHICNPPTEIRDLLGILLIVNSLVNPFAYAFLKKDIKKECEGILCRKQIADKTR